MSRPPPPDTHEADDQQAAYDLGYSDGVAAERERWQAVIEGMHDKVIPEAVAAERERWQADRKALEFQLDQTIANLSRNEADNERLRAALEMRAGRRQCLDNLMSNVEIAEAAIRKGE